MHVQIFLSCAGLTRHVESFPTLLNGSARLKRSVREGSLHVEYVRKLENGEPNGFFVIFDWPMHRHGHWPGRFTGEPMNARPHLEHATVL